MVAKKIQLPQPQEAPLAEIKKIKASFLGERVIADDTQDARTLYDQSRFGEPSEGKFQYSLVEALYLVQRSKMEITDKKKKLTFDQCVKKANEIEERFWIKYCVFKDMRSRGYIVKTALKFGADFRVYDRGVKPGEDHARWVLYPVHETDTLTWHEFSAKNRVAHSTRKRLLIGCVDEESDVTYWEIMWKRP